MAAIDDFQRVTKGIGDDLRLTWVLPAGNTSDHAEVFAYPFSVRGSRRLAKPISLPLTGSPRTGTVVLDKGVLDPGLWLVDLGYVDGNGDDRQSAALLIEVLGGKPATGTAAATVIIGEDGVIELPEAEYLTAADIVQGEGVTVTVNPDGTVTISAVGAGGGVTDHGALDGLADDDHPQYLTEVRGDTRYYTKSAVDGLLAPKATVAYVDNGLGLLGAAIAAIEETVGAIEVPETPADLGAATAAQGALAESAVQPGELAPYALITYVDSKIADLVGSAPEFLDTFAEIAAAVGDDPNFATTILTALGQRINVDQIGVANGVGSLGSDGRQPFGQLASHSLRHHSDVTGTFAYPPSLRAVWIWDEGEDFLGNPWTGFTLRRLTAADVVSGVFAAARIPEIPISRVTGLSGALAREIRLQIFAEGTEIAETDAPGDTEVLVAGTVALAAARATSSGSATLYIYRVRSGVETLIATLTFAAADVASASVTPTAIAPGDSLRCEVAPGASGIEAVEITLGVTS